jgi:hypothetical protein
MTSTESESRRRTRRPGWLAHLASGVDLAIDIATLGEYGLEPLPAEGPSCDASGREPGWEALARPRRGSCGARDRLVTRA